MVAFLLAILSTALLALSSDAATWDRDCDGDADTKFRIDAGSQSCWETTSADATLETQLINFVASTHKVSFTPMVDGTTTTAARLGIYFCLRDDKPAANPENECLKVAQLDGTEDDNPNVQDAFIWLGPGFYYLKMDVACAVGDTCVTRLHGVSS